MLTPLRQSQRPWPAIIVLIAALLYVGAVVGNNGGDPMSFVTYDGHFAYQIALRGSQAAPFLDVPAYRYQRILYPLLSRILSLGQAELVPWVLIAVNIAAVTLGTWAVEKLLVHFGTSHWYALIYGLYGGNFVALRTNLTEPLAYTLVALAILAWEKEHRWWAVAAFSLAALTKEVTLIFAVAYALYTLWQKDWRWTMALAAAGLPYASYQLILWAWLGSPGLGSGGAGATPFSPIPLGGWLSIINVNMAAFLLISLMVVPISVLPTLAGIGLSVRQLLAGLHHPVVYSLLLNSIALLFLPNSTFREGAAMVRLTEGVMLCMVLYGALVKSGRVLNYSVLWIFSNVLLIRGVA
ncbi:MAG: hypothetical protein H6667_24745 [Ardenticatenaceae bacterium]|nr:hypothetical protein [Ardenticatenaceae bacterium]MCB9446352.1 hypothetical protein [Ardenticatenaceae bacterium]